MPNKVDFYKLITGKTFEDDYRIPTMDEVVATQIKQLHSGYPLRAIGVGQDGYLMLSEEERSHLHIIGTTQEGKSKFIELLIKGDIKAGNGACLLDPTPRAATAYKVLNYCASIGFEKVCLIDPRLIRSHNTVTAINPIHPEYKNASVSNIMDTVRTVFKTSDPSGTSRIEKYLPAILHCLWNAKMTLSEAIYFTGYTEYFQQRTSILGACRASDRHRLILEDAFKSEHKWNDKMETTIGRLEPFLHSDMALTFGAEKGIDFNKMVADGWVILVNLHAGLGLDVLHSRLLGTTVINEIIFAIQRLTDRRWKGIYNLYVDEAGEYANRNLARHLELSAKTGLRITVSHQSLSQFEDPRIKNSVLQLCKDKIMFFTPSYDDRMAMTKAMGYGGDIPPAVAAYNNNNIPKQEAVVRIGKTPPRRIRIADTPDASDADIEPYLQNEWNYKTEDIQRQINARQNTESPRARKVSDQPATDQITPGKVRYRKKKSPTDGKEEPIKF